MSAQPEALRIADDLQAAVHIYPQMSEDEPGGYATEVDQVMDEAAAELRRLHAENEAKDALLRQAVAVIKGYRRELSGVTGSRIEACSVEDAIVTFLGEKATPDQGACVHVWQVTQQGQTYMDTRCLKCGKTERESWD